MPDIYRLYNSNNGSIIFYDYAGIPNLETSKMLDEIFTKNDIYDSEKELKEVFYWYGGNPLFIDLAAKHIKASFNSNIFNLSRSIYTKFPFFNKGIG